MSSGREPQTIITVLRAEPYIGAQNTLIKFKKKKIKKNKTDN